MLRIIPHGAGCRSSPGDGRSRGSARPISETCTSAEGKLFTLPHPITHRQRSSRHASAPRIVPARKHPLHAWLRPRRSFRSPISQRSRHISSETHSLSRASNSLAFGPFYWSQCSKKASSAGKARRELDAGRATYASPLVSSATTRTRGPPRRRASPARGGCQCVKVVRHRGSDVIQPYRMGRVPSKIDFAMQKYRFCEAAYYCIATSPALWPPRRNTATSRRPYDASGCGNVYQAPHQVQGRSGSLIVMPPIRRISLDDRGRSQGQNRKAYVCDN
jgi:hypothetical protein